MNKFRRRRHMARQTIGINFLVLFLLIVMMSPAAADYVRWDLRGVTIAPNYDWGQTPVPCGTISGWFTFDASIQSIGNWSIIAAVNPDQALTGSTNPFLFNHSNSVAYYGEPAISREIFFSYILTSPSDFSRSIHLAFHGSLDIQDLVPPVDISLYTYPDPDGSWYLAPEVYYVLPGGLLTSVPEPSTLLLLGSGLVGLIGFRRKFRK